MPFLYLAQKQNKNWIPLAAMKYIANYLSMPYISVYEVATFYTMYNLSSCWKIFCASLYNHTMFIKRS